MKPQLIILGAGAPREEGRPFGLQKVTLRGRVLDWQLDAFSALAPEVCFVGGYDIHAVMQQFPRLTYHFNADWQELLPLLASYWQQVCGKVAPPHAPGRLKLWLGSLRRNFVEAEALFMAIRTLAGVEEISRVLALHGISAHKHPA